MKKNLNDLPLNDRIKYMTSIGDGLKQIGVQTFCVLYIAFSHLTYTILIYRIHFMGGGAAPFSYKPKKNKYIN